MSAAPAGWPGRPFPLGATVLDRGTNFAVASEVAGGITLCLFDAAGTETRIPLADYDAGVWHAFVPGIGPGQAYGYRATGPYQPSAGIRCNKAKLLLDPYARAVSGTVRDGPAVLGYAGGDPDTLKEGKVAVSPGIGFGEYGDKYVRFALIENEHRTRQAIRGIRKALATDPRAGRQAFAAAR